jgi:UDP-galactopyranose mutase (EC 5.4.99.9)
MLANTEQTPLCCEYWCNFGDDLWQCPEDELRILAEKDLRQIGLLKIKRFPMDLLFVYPELILSMRGIIRLLYRKFKVIYKPFKTCN